MDIHKPKPVHNWREFANEVGVIFIGVTIALTAEQVVEAIHWRTEVAEIKATLDDEVREHLAEAGERVAVAPCEARQLKAVEDILRQPRPTPPLIPRVTVALRPWTTTGWTVATASGALPHMPLGERDAFAQHYSIVQLIGGYNQEEFLAIGDLGRLRGSEVLSESERDRLLGSLVRARQLGTIISTASAQLVSAAHRLGAQPLGKAALDDIAAERRACEKATTA